MGLFATASKTNGLGQLPLFVDRRKHAVYVHGREVHLSPGEYRVLLAMLDGGGRLFTTDEIQQIYAGQPYPGHREQLLSNVRTLIHRLRRALRGSGVEFQPIWGQGFRMEVPA